MTSTRFNVSQNIQDDVDNHAIIINRPKQDSLKRYEILVLTNNTNSFARLAGELELSYSPPTSTNLTETQPYDAILIDLSNFSDFDTFNTTNLQNISIPIIALLKEASIEEESSLYAAGINDCLFISELDNLYRTIFKSIQRSQNLNKQNLQAKSDRNVSVDDSNSKIQQHQETSQPKITRKNNEQDLAISLQNQESITQKLELLNQLALDLVHLSHLDEILDLTCKQTKEIIETDRVSVALISDTKTTYKIYIHDKHITGYRNHGEYSIDKVGILNQVVKSKELIVKSSHQIPKEQSELAKRGFQSFMSSPIMINDEVIATLNVASKSRDTFDTKEQLWLQQITSLISNALQKQNLLEKTQTALDATEIQAKRFLELNKLSKELMTAPDHEAICKMVLNELPKLIACNSVGFGFLTPDNTYLEIFQNSEDGKQFRSTGRKWRVQDISVSEAIAQRKIIRVNFKEMSKYIDSSFALKAGMHSGMLAPLILEDKILGSISLTSPYANGFSEQDEAFMLQVASLTAATIENKKLYEQSQETLLKLKSNEQELLSSFKAEERKSNELMLLERVQSAIADKFALEQIFETAVKTIAELLDYKAISLGHVRGDRIYLHPLHSHGYEGLLQEGYSVATDEGIQGLALSTASPVFVPSVHENPHYNPVIADVVSNIAIPVFSNGSIVAVLIVEHTSPLKQTDLSLLSKIAEQLTIAIENATLHEQILVDLKQTEALHTINQLLYTTKDFKATMRKVTVIATEALSAQWFLSEIYDASNNILIPGFFYKGGQVETVSKVLGKDTQYLATLSKERLAYQAIKNKEAVTSTQLLNQQILSNDIVKLQHSLGLTSTLSVPFFDDFKEKKSTGVVSIGRLEENGSFTEADLNFLKSIVRQVSIAIEQRQLNKRIEFLAFHDELTELPNRRLFEIKLKQAIEEAGKEQLQIGLVYLDLDGFKHVNDTLGHDIGDKLLQFVSNRLTSEMRYCDTLVRMGGDEFAIILNDISSREDAVDIATRYLEIIEQPFSLDGTQVIVTASIGISIYPEDGNDVSTLLKHSDIAMYLAKTDGRNNVRSFSQHLAVQARERLVLESNLRLAVENKDFILHYQPQYCLNTGDIIGAEALIRWNHPTDGLIAPYKFIPIAEETLLIIKMGAWALIEACKQAKKWHTQGHKITMSVNVAAPQFIRNNFIETVIEALELSGLEAEYLELEVTEGVVMHNIELVAVRLQELRDLGVSIALDDFGTGFSSLQYLQKLPFDKLKIDRSFIMNIGEIENDIHDKILVQNIMKLATGFDLKVVAEGIETKLQDDYLKSLGCQFAQGFYYARPLPATEVFKEVQTTEV